MPPPTFPPRKDDGLLAWSTNFRDRIAAQPGDVGLTAAQAAAYGVLHDAFAARYAVVSTGNGNATVAIGAKNLARRALLYAAGGAWELVNIVQAHPGTNDAMRGELGMRIRAQPVRVSAPRHPPKMSIVATVGRVVTIRLRDKKRPDSHGKPPGVRGATVLYAVGQHMPQHVSQWLFAMNTSKPVFAFEIPASVPAGSKVWLIAFWFNDKMQSGPAAHVKTVFAGEALARAA
jgi:hypothetical protein